MGENMVILIPIYTILIYIAIILSFPKNTIINNKYYVYISSFVLMILSFYVVYTTPILYTDRYVYSRIFNLASQFSLDLLFENVDHEPLFLLLTKLISDLVSNEIYFYVAVHLIFLFFLIAGLVKLKNWYTVIFTLFIFLNYIFYYSYILNGIRQGIAFACVIYLIGLLFKNKYINALIFSIIPIMFHYSSIPIVLIVFLIKYLNKYLTIKLLIIIYIMLSILYIFDLQYIFVGYLPINYLLEYSSSDLVEYFGEVNNLIFLIYNTIFLIIFYFYYSKNKNDNSFIYIYKIYIGFSLYFILFGFIAFSNRIAAYSWLIIPVVIALILENEKNKKLVLPILIITIIIGIFSGIPQYFMGIK